MSGIVSLDANIYNENTGLLLRDPDTYKKRFKKVIFSLRQNFNKSTRKGVTNKEKSWVKLEEYDPSTYKLYTQPKTHKLGTPTRPIVSVINSPPPPKKKLTN